MRQAAVIMQARGAWPVIEVDLRRALLRAGKRDAVIVAILDALRPEVLAVERAGTMQGLGRLMSSGLVIGSDVKLLIIGGRKVTYTKNDNSFQTIAGDKVLVQVKGSPSVDEKTLKDYLAALHWKEIEKAGAR